MKAKTDNVSLSVIAGDALEFVQYGKDQARWLAALMTSIQLDLKHNKGRIAVDLASLGQYLGEDCANYLDVHAGKLQSQLDVAEVSQ